MNALYRALAAVAVSVAALCICASAGAAIVTIGPSLTGGGWESEECGVTTCTVANYELGGVGPTLTSPVTGAIVRFGVLGGSTPGTYRLRTVHPGEIATSWFFKKEAAAVAAVPNPGIQAYPVSLPITAGETIGLTMSETASIASQEGIGRSTWWEIEPPENGHVLGISERGIFGFNAEVQPAPTIVSLGTVSGPTAGGTAVAITGTDFENTSGVTFGSTPATSFTVESESRLTAVAPGSAAAATVPVTVTTVAGKASSAQTFTYEAPPPAPRCVVPKLRGKKLKAAKKALQQARCKLGKVRKSKGATGKAGKVAGQSPKPGTRVPVHTKVKVTLKP